MLNANCPRRRQQPGNSLRYHPQQVLGSGLALQRLQRTGIPALGLIQRGGNFDGFQRDAKGRVEAVHVSLQLDAGRQTCAAALILQSILAATPSVPDQHPAWPVEGELHR